MTPYQKIKWAILLRSAISADEPAPDVTESNVDELYCQLVEEDGHWDAKYEMRGGVAGNFKRPEYNRII